MPPLSPDRAASHAADVAACRALLRDGSRTFYAASFLLPGSVRDSATALYAFCRLADDAVDLDTDGAAALVRMRERLALAYEGRPLPLAPDRAFAHIVEQFAIPRALPEALLEGFEWDVLGRRYEDFDSLQDYAARVAGTVGAMMTLLMGVRAPEVVARACDLGVAMQLSNIARDVGEDARAGRLYLPRQWLAEAGIDADGWLRQPVYSDALGSVIQRLLRAADAIYDRVDAGIGRLPAKCRPGIRAARLLYADIGHEVERRALDSVSSRAVVPGWRKASLLTRAVLAPAAGKLRGTPDPLEAVRFLLDAVALEQPRRPLPAGPQTSPPHWWDLDERVGRIVELFSELDQRERIDPAAIRPSLPLLAKRDLPPPPWWKIDERIGWAIELFAELDRRDQGQGMGVRA
jgi:phytoene synthase